MIEVSQAERNYILAGNYELLNAVIVTANREILLLEKRYDDMLERKNAEIAALKTNAIGEETQPRRRKDGMKKHRDRVLRNWKTVPLNDLVNVCKSVRGAKYLLLQRSEVVSEAKAKGIRPGDMADQMIVNQTERK